MTRRGWQAATEVCRRWVERRIDWNALALLGDAQSAVTSGAWERPVPSRHRASNWSRSRGKRVLDCVLASLLLTLLLAPMLLIALLVRLSSPGPVIYRQLRVGRMGQAFTIYKFRTMRPRRLEHADEPMFMEGTDRITAVGHWLRRWKLDELPQLWNILKGEMSFVGPRPKLAHLEAMVQMPYRPGITGAATLVFRNEAAMVRPVPLAHLEHFYDRRIKPLKARIDMRYMRQATLRKDFELLLTVFFWMLPARRSMSMHSAVLSQVAGQAARPNASSAVSGTVSSTVSIAALPPIRGAGHLPVVSHDSSLLS